MALPSVQNGGVDRGTDGPWRPVAQDRVRGDVTVERRTPAERLLGVGGEGNVSPRRNSRSSSPASIELAESGDDAAPARARLVLTIFLPLLLAYLLLFFGQEIVAGVSAYERLFFLLLPDQMLTDWLGGELGRVTPWDRTGPVAVVMVMLAIACLVGHLTLDACRVTRHLDRLETVVLSVGVGLHALSLFTLVVGLMGQLRQPVWFVMFGVLTVAGYVWRFRHGGGLLSGIIGRGTRARSRVTDASMDREGRVRELGRATPWWSPRWWCAVVPFALVLCAGALLPPLDFDVLEYHLQVPKEWHLQGRVTFLPHNVYGNMPLGGEMLAATAMALMPGEFSWWWGALAGKLAMATFTLLTTALLLAAGRRWFSRRAGVIAALLYISTAWVHVVSQNGLNEAVVGFYLFACFFVIRIWWDVDASRGGRSAGLVVLAGLLAGAAVACKYTSVVLVVLPALVAVAWRSRPRCLRDCLMLLLAVAAACGLWLGKNWYFTGNPTYPLLYRVMGGETRTAEKDAQWRQAHQVPRDSCGRRYGPRQAWQATLGVLGGSVWQNPLIVPFATLLVLRRDSRSVQLYWLTLLFMFLVVWWAATHRLERFWVPTIPIMALLAAGGATWSSAWSWQRAASIVLGVGLVANFIFIVAPRPQIADNRYFVSLEQLRDDPRMTFPPDAYAPVAFRYLEEHVPAGSRALVVGNAAVFPLQVQVLYNTCFDDCTFENLFRDRTAQQRRTLLVERGISHIYIDWAELGRYRQPGNYGYSPYVTRELVHGELVAQQRLLRPVNVPGLEPELGEVFEVVPSNDGW